MTARDTAAAAVKKHGLAIKSKFVPYTRSRNFSPSAKLFDKSLNWLVTLLAGDREIITTDYSAGIGHCPSYPRLSTGLSLRDAESIEFEVEHGRRRVGELHPTGAEQIEPDTLYVLHSLVSDADVLNYATYEDWAIDFGYDPDSRKGEAIYRECLEIALKLSSRLGAEVLSDLREAFRDF